MRPLFLTLLLGTACVLGAQSQNLDIYWIDVEGGASTLVVSPSGESMLIDTGYTDGDRDAKRIYAATQLAGLKKIDYVVISHFHADHAGGLPALSKMIPMGKFFSRSDEELEKQNERWRDSFNAVAGGKRTIVKPGDSIPFKGVETVVVASDAKVLTKPVKGGGAANPLCADAEQKAPAGPENQRMVGLMLTFGKFKLLTLAALDWERGMGRVGPVNQLGAIILYHSSRHGGLDGSAAPAFLGAIRPQVVVMNNGPRKGMGQKDATVKSTTPGGMRPYEKNSYLRLRENAGGRGIWK